MMHMKFAPGLAVLCVALNCQADPNAALTLSAVQAMSAVKLTKQELDTLLPGAKVRNIASTGSTRSWVNEADGKFIASSDNRAGGRPSTAKGTWEIGADGTYCVSLAWGRFAVEKWCRFLFKDGEEFWGVRSLSDPASEATRFVFSK